MFHDSSGRQAKVKIVKFSAMFALMSLKCIFLSYSPNLNKIFSDLKKALFLLVLHY